MVNSSRGRRMSWMDSAFMEVDEGYERTQHEQAQFGCTAYVAHITALPTQLLTSQNSLPRNVSQPSMNYDLSSYEAKRLLNLVEEPPFEDQSIASEGQFQPALSRRQSYTLAYHPAHSDAPSLLPQTNSDALYMPMRRRSLLTPGVATRPVPADLIIPLNTQDRDSPSPTEQHGPTESPGVMFLSTPHSSFDTSSIPRAHTPCETDYKQTGAFKHGTLRITNGSPVRTPAWEMTDDGSSAGGPSTSMNHDDYFDTESRAQDKQNMDSDDSQCSNPPCLATASSATSTDNLTIVPSEREAAISLLPELKLTMSPFSIGEIEQESLGLQTTSKHTATEDRLFEDESPEYDTEILNVRLDHDVEPHSSSTSASPDKGKQKDINRSDSGIAASPTHCVPHKSLSKADSGYSSSVSIRSLSSKRNGQDDSSNPRKPAVASPKALASEHAKLSNDLLMRSHSDTVGPAEVQSQTPSADQSPPPVPEKDHAKVPKQDSRARSGRSSQISNSAIAGKTSEPTRHSPTAPKGPSSLIPTLSISNARKPGRLQRLLSGARAPLAVHATHALNSGAKVPPVPQAVQEKLHEHTGLSPNSEDPSESIYTWHEESKLSVAAERPIAHDSTTRAPRDNGSRARTDRDRTYSFKSHFHIQSLGSTITRAASSVISKNSILRKPPLTKTKPSDLDAIYPELDPPATNTQHPGETLQWRQKGVANNDSTPLASASGKGLYTRPAMAKGRSNSLSASIGDPNSGIYNTSRRNSLVSQSEQHVPIFQRPPFQEQQYLASRTPPPVSMTTRNIGPLRVPAPIRPRSTPPVRSGAPALSHKSSREAIQSYPPYNSATSSNHVRGSRPPSQEPLYTYSAAELQILLNQASQMANINATRPLSVQPLGGYGPPGGIYNLKHPASSSQDPLFDHSRRNSLTSQTSHRSTPSNRQPWSHYPPYDTPTLRRQSSHDSFSFQTRQNQVSGYQPYPSLSSANGQTYVTSFSNNQFMLHQPKQYQPHAQHASRGHLRHHSLDQRGPPAPYRVLHSYNSPAYRGVPIWSG
ncbi:hypothetical protein NUW58_g7911 [Xylaria curta]|uniref:Uncharacterized protein n=1 Tax=Xylaria curta TaxID=42375 RepID=A0ACC1NEQ9_9PEZI|nr:hypothetical protein NUW58_g7911 [Xylaria curta]